MNNRQRAGTRVVLCLMVACCLVFVARASADTLEMKDGRVLQGRYLGGTQAILRFEINGEVKTFSVSDVVAVTFTRGETPTNYPADSNQGAPPAANPPAAGSAPPAAAAPDSSQPPIVSQDVPPGAATSPAPAPRAQSAYSSGPPAQPAPASGASDQITIPAGTALLVRMVDGVDSSKNSVGDVFHATLETDFYVSGVFVARKGSDVYGRLAEAKEAGRLSGRSELQLELTRMVIDGREYPLTSADYTVRGESRNTDTAKKVGGGAVVGAIIGAIAGGGKGAAIGAGVGSAAGAGVQILTRGEKVKVPSETLLEFRLEQPASVTPTQR